jgi:hypothetical protein
MTASRADITNVHIWIAVICRIGIKPIRMGDSFNCFVTIDEIGTQP